MCDILCLAVGGFAYFTWGIDVLGICDLSADLTIAVNDKCIDPCGELLCPYFKGESGAAEIGNRGLAQRARNAIMIM